MNLYISNGLFYLNEYGVWYFWTGNQWVLSQDAIYTTGAFSVMHNRWLSDLRLIGKNVLIK